LRLAAVAIIGVMALGLWQLTDHTACLDVYCPLLS